MVTDVDISKGNNMEVLARGKVVRAKPETCQIEPKKTKTRTKQQETSGAGKERNGE